MKKATIIHNRWSRLTDKLYTRSDLRALLLEIKTTDTADFEEVSERVWEEAETMNHLSIGISDELIVNERLALQMLELKKNKERTKRMFIMKRWGSMAAMILLCLSSYFIYHYYSEKQASTVLCEISVPYGKTHSKVLPDGTKVTMNAGSILKYPKQFGRDMRYVEFTGEGFFDVSKSRVPFLICSNGYNVKVLGTSFNLKNYTDSEQVSLTLCTGKVLMSFEDEQISLRPGELLLLNKQNNELERSRVDTQNYTSWMKGKFYFNKTSVNEVVRMLERYYDCRITLDPQSTFPNKISGTHDNKSLEAVLHSIKLATGIGYRHEDGCYILYKDTLYY